MNCGEEEAHTARAWGEDDNIRETGRGCRTMGEPGIELKSAKFGS